jgi:hypothetical protein
MLSTFLEKAEGLLNRRFVVAYWFPTFLAGVLGLVPRAYVWGLDDTLAWWRGLASGDDTIGQLWVTLLMLLTVTLIAYLLQVFTRPILQFFEGYLLWPERTKKHRVAHHHAKLKDLKLTVLSTTEPEVTRAQAMDKLVHNYPPKSEQILPTRLGNVLKAAEAYGDATYHFDMPFWWPRLWSVLPESEQTLVQDALTSLISLLNLAVLLVYVSFDDIVYLLLYAPGWQKLWAALVVVVAWGLAGLCYEGAVVQARSYGVRLRTAVDLYRFDLLKTLHQSLPATPKEERQLWPRLKQWLYDGAVGPILTQTYAHAEGGDAEKTKAEEEASPALLRNLLRRLL